MLSNSGGPFKEKQDSAPFGWPGKNKKDGKSNPISLKKVVKEAAPDPTYWDAYTYRGTVFDANKIIIRLKKGTNSDGELRYIYPQNLEDKVNDGSAQIRLQDGITKTNADEVVKSFENGAAVATAPDQYYWVHKGIKGLTLNYMETKALQEPMHDDGSKATEWMYVKPPRPSVDPLTGELNEEVLNQKLPTDAKHEYYNRYEQQLLDEMFEAKQKRAYTKGYVEGYRMARSMRKGKRLLNGF